VKPELPPNVRDWATLSGAELRGEVARDPVVVLPLAATEQHGPHLPLSTDVDIGLGILSEAFAALGETVPAWALAPFETGASEEHMSFPGTRSMSGSDLVGAIERVGASLADVGVRRLVLSNSHGGNRFAMEEAGLRLRRSHGLLVVKASWFRFGRPDDVDLPDSEWRHGLHGGAIETAMMLWLRPKCVRTENMDVFPSLGQELEGTLRRLGPEGEASFAWLAEDLNASGVTGDARLATSEAGRRLVRHYGAALADVVRDALDFPLDRLGSS
jgi:creatinine amidohydrolase